MLKLNSVWFDTQWWAYSSHCVHARLMLYPRCSDCLHSSIYITSVIPQTLWLSQLMLFCENKLFPLDVWRAKLNVIITQFITHLSCIVFIQVTRQHGQVVIQLHIQKTTIKSVSRTLSYSVPSACDYYQLFFHVNYLSALILTGNNANMQESSLGPVSSLPREYLIKL